MSIAAATAVALFAATGLAAADERSRSDAKSWVAPAEGPRANWRTREILDAQREAAGESEGMTGPETQAIYETYRNSLGKGGGGAALPSRTTRQAE